MPSTQPNTVKRKTQLQEDVHFWVMRRLQETSDINQRELARELGISLGSVNYCLQALMEKGWVKMQNFSKSKNKLGYAYLLTPLGIAEKSALTKRFLKRKLEEYEALREEIEALKKETDW
ncbi:MarR family EPS-associated transcriptional regulator [Oxalobacter sp. OttesenSCG-928-P03]|nr:MarR family EPS-associated transcriptional regulator [Oxalobacter sp. OttesenSCG-928-P03]